MLIRIASQYQSSRSRLEFAGSNHCLTRLCLPIDFHLHDKSCAQLSFGNKLVTSRLGAVKSHLSGVPRCWIKVFGLKSVWVVNTCDCSRSTTRRECRHLCSM